LARASVARNQSHGWRPWRTHGSAGVRVEVVRILYPPTLDPMSDYKLKSIVDASADDALVEFDGHVGNYGRSAYIGDCTIGGA
jgi:hypothetical protein